jgi:hypothetical protein
VEREEEREERRGMKWREREGRKRREKEDEPVLPKP